jgi:hypothetical protein
MGLFVGRPILAAAAFQAALLIAEVRTIAAAGAQQLFCAPKRQVKAPVPPQQLITFEQGGTGAFASTLFPHSLPS